MMATTPIWRLIPQASLVAAPWRNGLGVSREIAVERGPDGELRWQVGIADLVQDAEFSDYPQYDRIFTPIEGAPPALAFQGGAFEVCPLLVPKAFPGDVPTLSRIEAAGRAFNLIYDRRLYRGRVQVVREDGAIELPAASHLVVHCLQGTLRVGDQVVGLGDSVVGPAPIRAETPATLIIAALSFLPGERI